jgi:hypothetical protein
VRLFLEAVLKVLRKHRARIESEPYVEDRKHSKITLPSLEHLKEIMRDAPSLENIMNADTDQDVFTRVK